MILPALWLALAAQAAPSACVPFAGIGCYLPPAAAPAVGAPVPLLIYLRGHLDPYGGSVPPEQRVASAQQAVEFYGLAEAARAVGAALLVTGSSDLGVGDATLASLEGAARVRFGALYLASHSGSYVALQSTLGKLRRPERLIMLDNFYFGQAFSQVVQQQVAAGTVCTGFYTAHNADRYKERFQPFVYCPVQKRDDLGHNGAVNRCLGRWLTSLSCD